MHTVSIESFAIVITISMVEFEGTRIVVLAFHPSEDFPLRIGVLGSEYAFRSTTHVTMSVWFMAKNFVRFAVPDGGVSPLDGRSKVGSRVETFDLADPFTNVHTDAGSSCTVVELLGMVEFIYAISGD